MVIEELKRNPFAIVAHRGDKEWPNSLKGIKRALRRKVDIIEIDVRLSRDGIPILLHDPTFERVSGIDKAPKDLTLQEIRESILLFDSEPVPTLEEALILVDGRAGLFIEIKEPEAIGVVMELLTKYNAFSWTAIISFWDEVVKEAKKLNPSVTTGLVYSKPPGRIKEAKNLGADMVLPYYPLATYKANRFAHALGLYIVAWTINEEEWMIETLRRGADAFATDDVGMASRLRKKIEDGGVIFKKRFNLQTIATKEKTLLHQIVFDENHLFLEQNWHKESRYGKAYWMLKEKDPNYFLFWEIKDGKYTQKVAFVKITSKKELDRFLEEILEDRSFQKFKE